MPRTDAERPLDWNLQDLVDAGRIHRCGAITIAGRSLGVPLTAAAVQVAQACRVIADGSFCDLADVSLINCGRVRTSLQQLPRAGTSRWSKRDEQTNGVGGLNVLENIVGGCHSRLVHSICSRP